MIPPELFRCNGVLIFSSEFVLASIDDLVNWARRVGLKLILIQFVLLSLCLLVFIAVFQLVMDMITDRKYLL